MWHQFGQDPPAGPCHLRLSRSRARTRVRKIQVGGGAGPLNASNNVCISIKNQIFMLINQDLNKTIDNYNYNINNLIGKGAFSSVYLGKSNITGEAVAIKVINLGSLTVDTYQKLQYELAILRSLPAHPNVVKVLSLLQTVNNVYIVTEHCDRKLTNATNLDNTAVTLGIIEGLKHLYANNIVHRDIKPDNILLKNGVPKIIDFGFAKTISGPHEMMRDHLGTPLYMAPQMFDNAIYTSKCDIWSLGVTLHELVYKCDPYRARDIEDLRRKIKMTQPPVFLLGYNDPLNNIIKRCLVAEENQRISWQQLFALADQLKFSKTRAVSPESIIQYGKANFMPFKNGQVQIPQIPIAYY